MRVFNSIGSNYSAEFVSRSLRPAKPQAISELKEYIANRYSSRSVQLTFKGREAIVAILESYSLPKDSKVVINGYTCYAAYDAVRAASLSPLLVDIEPDYLNYTATHLKEVLRANKDISAVIVQNTFGQLADIDEISRLCQLYQVKLIEDLALANGLRYPSGREVGSVGDAAALSFSQDKMVDGVSGGAAVWQSQGASVAIQTIKVGLRQRITCRLYPSLTRFVRATHHIVIGKAVLAAMKTLGLWMMPMNGDRSAIHDLPAWNAGMVIYAYGNIDGSIAHRQKLSQLYHTSLPMAIQLRWQPDTAFLRFPILIEEPEKLIKYLEAHGIFTGNRWFNAPVGQIQYMPLTDYIKGECPNAEYVAQRIVNLPTHINISEVQAANIAEKVNTWLK